MATREVPASIGQRLVWFLDHYRAESSSVNCPAVFRISGPFDDARVVPALELLVGRHEALRATLVRRGRQLVARIPDRAPVSLSCVDLTGAAEEELQRRLGEELWSAIPVDQSPVRFTLWRMGARDRVLCVNMHHLVSDAWSCGIVINDVIGALRGAGGQPPAAWQYSRFVEWQRELECGGELRAHQRYWVEKLRGARLPELRGTGRVDGGHTALCTAELPGSVGDGLRALARAQRTTLFTVFLALYYALLHRVTGQQDLAVASFFANRTRPQLHGTVGFLANMLVLRTDFEAARPFRDLVGRVRRTVMDAVVHQAVPCQMLPLPSLLHSPGRVNDVVFQMLPDRSPDSWQPTALEPGVTIDTFRPSRGLSRFGLNLTVIPRGDRIDARLSYAADRFPPGWAGAFLDGYAGLAAEVLRDPDAPLPNRPV